MSDKGPLLSVVTATYNAAHDLPRLIASLAAQTDQDFEWVVADGVSTDGTLELLEQARQKLQRVVVDSRPDFGIYDALNRAVKLASGEYYLVVGADDMLFPEAIERYKAACVATGADLITAKVLFGDDPRPRGRYFPAWDFLWGQKALVSNHAVGLVIRRSLHEHFGYYSRKFPISADQLFIMQAVRGGAGGRAGFRGGSVRLWGHQWSGCFGGFDGAVPGAGPAGALPFLADGAAADSPGF